MENETKNGFKFTLKYSNCVDSPKFRAAIKKLDTFPLWVDSKAKIVDYDRYVRMIENGLIEDHRGCIYSTIEEGRVGVVCETYYACRWPNVWEQISCCKNDFIDGWEACEKGYQMLRDWEEAIAHEKARNDWNRVMKRKFTIDVSKESNVYYSYVEDLEKCIEGVQKAKLSAHRNGKSWITVECKCDGEGLYRIAHDIGMHIGWWDSVLPQNPRELECRQSYGWSTGKKYACVKRSYSNPAEACVQTEE